jgi:hypothetical protein
VIIQVILAALVVLIITYSLQHRRATGLRAGLKLLFLILAVSAVVTIARPEFLTAIAHVVGVGRGTDLLLYGFVMGFVFFAIATYLKFKDYEQRIAKLARHIAIAEAELRERG